MTSRSAVTVSLFLAVSIGRAGGGDASVPSPMRTDDERPGPRIAPAVPAPDAQPEIRVLYFVPSDLSPSATQQQEILQVSRDVHRWYTDHSDSTETFFWGGTVEQVLGLQPLSYYAVDYWARVLTELTNRGYPIWGAQKVFSIWVKGGLFALGGQGGGWGGVGMVGCEAFLEEGCVPTHPSLWPCTPGGAMAHELGHAFGMPHPNVVGSWGDAYNDNTVMYAHWNFPERYARTWTVPSPWGLLDYERDHLRYNPVVQAPASAYPPPPNETFEFPPYPIPALALSANRLNSSDTQLTWNGNGASQYSVYWSTDRTFGSYTAVSGSPTTGLSLTHSSSGALVYFKAFEIPLSN